MKEKYGSDAEDVDEDEDSEDAESEDEDGEELTPAVDAAILRTLARIKRKDPSIYEQGKNVFEGDLNILSGSTSCIETNFDFQRRWKGSETWN